MQLIKASLVLLFSSNAMAFCFDEAGKRYNVNPKLLKSIAKVESSLNPKAMNYSNNNGTYDIGLMQINSTWLNKLSEFGISEPDLINNPCTNVHVGAWILSTNFATHGYNRNSLGAYNAGFGSNRQSARDRYIGKVEDKFYK
ncbi:lytic transglycosylase domain-containing protein [Vibrio sonorensis]|uniref:lytic transglycosylase domain-containing protein n=1 Tax=Vibrio sonorensis TaxID=1004316 RepID=UPI0008DAD413|nr:lytic transglycosylase domain-containing protein [Vibrio sonorensis]